MKLMKMTCNNCGSQLDIDLDNLQAYCPFCGQKLLLDFDQVDKVIKEKEQTKRVQAHETETTKRKQMDYEYQERKEKRENTASFKMIGLCFLFMALCFGMLYFNDYKREKKHVENNEVQITFSAKDVKGEIYTEVISRFESIGLYDIELIENQDVIVGIFTKDGEVEKVTVNGDSSFEENDWISTDSHVIITYHTRKNK